MYVGAGDELQGGRERLGHHRGQLTKLQYVIFFKYFMNYFIVNFIKQDAASEDAYQM